MIGAYNSVVRRDIWVRDTHHYTNQTSIKMDFKEGIYRLTELASKVRGECARGQTKHVKDEEATRMPNAVNRSNTVMMQT